MMLQPENDYGYKMLAATYLAGKDLEKAIATLKKAEELHPEKIAIQMMMGRTYLSQRNLDKAMETYKKIETLSPKYAPAHFFQGNVFELRGDRKGAVIKHEKALELDPNYVPALNNLAYLYAEGLGDIDKAVELAQKAKKLAPKDGSVTDTLGWTLFRSGNYDEAIKNFTEATYYLPGNPSIRYHSSRQSLYSLSFGTCIFKKEYECQG
jgi:tetratricopeptide (TPR) repeat protein